MGWDSCQSITTKKAAYEDVKNSCLRSNWKILGEARTRSAQYLAVETPTGSKFIHVTITQRHGREIAWKTMSEHMGPCETDCPAHLLELVPDPCESYSTKWRTEVLAYNERKNREIPFMALIELYGKQYRYLGKEAGQRTASVVSLDGKKYRLKASQHTDIKVL